MWLQSVTHGNLLYMRLNHSNTAAPDGEDGSPYDVSVEIPNGNLTTGILVAY